MASMNTRAKEVIAELDQFEFDMNLTNKWVHGDENSTVLLGGVSTPSIRNLVKNFRMSAQEILDAASYIQDNYEGLEDIIDANREYAEIAETLLLRISDWMARDLAEMNRMNIDRYHDWYAHGIERVGDAGREAEQAAQNVRDLIAAYDESYAQHRLQVRLFDGTNPGSTSKPVLFVIAGQSVSVGFGNYKPYETAPECGWYWSWRDGANTLKPLVDPIGQVGNLGSGWCGFARRFFNLTGRKVILLSIGSGGAAVTDGGYTTDNTWADNGYGTLRSSRQAIWNAFSAAVPASSYDLGAILWGQGAADADRLYAGTVTVSDYKTGTLDVLSWLKTLIGNSSCPVLITRIGHNKSALTIPAYKAAYEAIQNAQVELCDWSSIYPGFSMAPYFADAWDVYNSDGIHYSQLGYRIMGNCYARSAAYILSL